MKIAVIAAMDKEIDLFKSYLNNISKVSFYHYQLFTGSIGDNFIIVAKSGIGKVASSALTTTLINKYNPDLLINMGIAGGFDKNLKTLDTIIVTAACYTDVDMTTDDESLRYGQLEGSPLFFEVNPKLISRIKEILQGDIIYGKIATGDQFVVDYQKSETLVNKYFKSDHILGFDMETAAFLQVANSFNVNALVIRSISDLIGSTTPFNYNYFSVKASEKSCEICKKIIQNL